MTSTLAPNLRALVVGGTGGIGRAIAIQLANSLPSSSITIAGRSIAKTKAELEASGEVQNGNIDYIKVDCGSMEDTKRMCREVASDLAASGKDVGAKTLDMLVLTPGILTMAGRNPTSDGIDFKMSLHYYSRMLIIRELLASSSLSPSAIIVSVLDGWTSDAHSSKILWDDMDLSKPNNFGISRCATHCLGFTDVQLSTFGSDTAESNVNRTYIHAYPGGVNTGLLNGLPTIVRWGLSPFKSLITVEPDVCAAYMLQGVERATRAQAESDEGKRWWNIDNKGNLLSKKEVSQEMRTKVQEHTWAMVRG